MNTKEPTEAQIKEFWEWCGLSKRGGYWWYDMEGNHLTANSPPPIDLNNLFKYAVPKLDVISLIRFDMSPVKGEREYTARVFMPEWEGRDLDYKVYSWCDKDPALALFWSIWGIIKEKKHND